MTAVELLAVIVLLHQNGCKIGCCDNLVAKISMLKMNLAMLIENGCCDRIVAAILMVATQMAVWLHRWL